MKKIIFSAYLLTITIVVVAQAQKGTVLVGAT